MTATINMLDIEYDIEESFVTGLRAVFKYDDKFVFDQDSKLTKLIVTSAFPEKDEEMKIPQIVVSVTGFQISQTSLFNNLYGDIIENGNVVGTRFATPVPYTVSMVCIAHKDGIAKDLANKTLKYIAFTATEIFNDTLCLNILDVSKSPGGPSRQIPDKAFAHTVSLRGSLHWIGSKTYTAEERNILQKIKLELTNKK